MLSIKFLSVPSWNFSISISISPQSNTTLNRIPDGFAALFLQSITSHSRPSLLLILRILDAEGLLDKTRGSKTPTDRCYCTSSLQLAILDSDAAVPIRIFPIS